MIIKQQPMTTMKNLKIKKPKYNIIGKFQKTF